MKNQYSNIKFSDKYLIKTEEYEDVGIITFPFSVRAHNCFKKAKIKTVASLIQCSELELMEIQGFGRKCLKEVNHFCSNLSKLKVKTGLIGKTQNENCYYLINKFQKEILNGDFSFIDQISLKTHEKIYLLKLEDAYVNLGREFVFFCINSSRKIPSLISVISNFKEKTLFLSEINSNFRDIPKGRHSQKVFGYINAFTSKLDKQKKLKKVCFSDDECFYSFYENVISSDFQHDYILFSSFFKWSSFDLHGEINKIFEVLYFNTTIKLVVQSRTIGKTLAEIGEQIGLSRERVRQIEARCKKDFSRLESGINIIPKICAEKNNEKIVLINDIEKYAGIYTDELIYLLKSCQGANYVFFEELDAFVVGDISVVKKTYGIINSLPNFINIFEESMILYEISLKVSMPYDLVRKIFLRRYDKIGNFYHKGSLSVGEVYSYILKKYYPVGLNVYSDSVVKEFRTKVCNEFGDFKLPLNDRALASGIMHVSILCGRGVYRFNSRDFISNSLLQKMVSYIENSKNTVFLITTIFNLFKKDLELQGITNRYFLHGILHDYLKDKFTFTRDCISKDKEFKSIYLEVEKFISRSQYPVSKEQLKDEFLGITEIMINFATRRPGILNFFGKYMAESNLIFYEGEKEYLYNKIGKFVRDGSVAHIKELYCDISQERGEIFTRNSALDSFSAFSILECLFSNSFQFSRPNIALQGKDICTSAEQMHNFLYSFDEITIFEIQKFARKIHFQISSILDFVDECNDEYMIVNNNLIMKISKLGIDETIAKTIENILAKYVNKTMIIANITILENLPKINYAWTDWLIYSVLKKWSTLFSVGINSTQLRYSIPLVAPRGTLDVSEFKDVDISSVCGMFKNNDSDEYDFLEEFSDEELFDCL